LCKPLQQNQVKPIKEPRMEKFLILTRGKSGTSGAGSTAGGGSFSAGSGISDGFSTTLSLI